MTFSQKNSCEKALLFLLLRASHKSTDTDSESLTPPLNLRFQNDVISKLFTCGVSLAIYLSLCKLLPVDRSIDDDFVMATPFYLQVVYLYLAMLALRPKYYFVWTFGEYP